MLSPVGHAGPRAMPIPSFQNLRVLVLESRRRTEMAALVVSHGGQPMSAPAMRELPLESNTEARAAIECLVRGDLDVLISLTGVGLKAALDLAEETVGPGRFEAALRAVRVIARGPKPASVLRGLDIVPWIVAPEPNTWREVLGAIDAKGAGALQGLRVMVQEYGTSSSELLGGLASRGATVTRMPIYRYSLPDDVEPLRLAVRALVDGVLDVALFTTATQVTHLLGVADDEQRGAAVRQALGRVVVASIGPTTSEELSGQGIAIDIEASHPKMGVLVREAAEYAPRLVGVKRGQPASPLLPINPSTD